MKKLLTLFCSILALSSWAQWHHDCGVSHTPEEMQNFYNRDKSHLVNNAKALVKLPVIYHVIGQDDGSGAFKMDDLLELHCSLNEDFGPAEIEFIIMDIKYIDSDYYYNFEGDAEGDLFDTHNVTDHCNIYLTDNPTSGGTTVCGFATLAQWAPWGYVGGIVLSNSCSLPGSTTLTHEMGHYLNLAHTFDGQSPPTGATPSGYERVDGANCNNAADGFCDTPPDYIPDRWTCNGNSESSTLFEDPVGVEFRVDGKNYMSYSSDVCMEYFSPDQQAEMNAAPSNYRPYLLTVPLDEYSNVQGATTIVYPEDEAENLAYNNVTLRWDSVAGAEMYHVQVATSNFDINTVYEELIVGTSVEINSFLADEDYIWRVKPINYRYTCASYTSVHEFSTSAFSGTVSTSAPNCPGETTGASVNFDNPQAGYTYSWSSPDPQLNLIMGGYNTSSITNMSVGSYVLEVTNGGDVLNLPFEITGVSEIQVAFTNTSNSITADITGGTPPYATVAWSSGANGAVNTNPVDGTNTLSIFDANGCAKSFNVEFEENNGGGVAINEIDAALQGVVIYPNPLTENTFNLDINIEKSNKTAEVAVYAITGQQVLTTKFDLVKGNNTVKVATGDLTQGVYFVKTAIDKYQHTQRLVVLK